MISRTIQGKADESCGGFFTTGSEIAVSGGCITTTANVSNSELADATKDGEPDIFSFSVGGYSGKFYIEKQTGPVGNKVKGKVVLIPQQDVKIDYIVTSVEGSDCSNRFRLQRFMLTTPDGVKYEFGSCDNSPSAIEIMNNNESNFWTANGWYLKKISSADGVNSIVLNYTAEAYRYHYRSSRGGTGMTPKIVFIRQQR